MKARENIYDLLSEYMNVDEQNICVLEEQIDSETQFEYFECSRNNENTISKDEVIRRKDLIFDENVPTDEKKILLVQLASTNHVEAYRTIEKYLRKPNIKLYEWAYIALLESRLLLESQILDEDRILVTSGLGGKGNKLRYFIVFFTDDGSAITSLQQKIIENQQNQIEELSKKVEELLEKIQQ